MGRAGPVARGAIMSIKIGFLQSRFFENVPGLSWVWHLFPEGAMMTGYRMPPGLRS
jgi:hypothetical protein